MATPASSIKVNVNSTFLGETSGKAPEAGVYIFSPKGELVGNGSLDADGNVSVDVRAKEGQRLTVFVGPKIEGEVSAQELRRRGAHEQTLRATSGVAELAVTIAQDRWEIWPRLHRCTVRGTLYKRFPFPFFQHDQVISHATVEVYEVDPWPRIIVDLPRAAIDKLRDYFRKPRPFPPPPPEPLVDLGEFSGPTPPMPPGVIPVNPLSGAQANSLVAEDHRHAATFESSVDAGAMADLKSLALTANDLEFRQALILRPEIIRPILCLIYPIAVKMTLVATAITDDCGHFETSFYHSIFRLDQPDLYFKAKQHIFPFGFLTTIYAPTPVACYTWWNYVCGTEVSLYSTHPFAISRPPCPDFGDGVIVDRVGDFSLDSIYGTSTRLQPDVIADSARLGLAETDASLTALGFKGQPWGGVLRLRLEFDTDLPTNDVKYYRVRYRRHGSATTPTPLNATVTWSAVRFPGGGAAPVYSSYDIGPKVAPNGQGDLFEIHSRGNDAPGGIGFWSPLGSGGVVANNTNAIFDTTAAGAAPAADPPAADNAGLFDLIIDLFDANGNGVNLATAGIKFYVPPSVSGDVTADDAATLGLIAGNTFVMTLSVDNNRPIADVQDPTLDGAMADPDCGVLEYDGIPPDIVRIPFIAGQRNGWATYALNVRKAGTVIIGTPTAAVGAGSVLPPPKEFAATADSLRGNCAIAAFSAELGVNPLAITGWGPVYTSVSDVYAFAIAPSD